MNSSQVDILDQAVCILFNVIVISKWVNLTGKGTLVLKKQLDL